MKLLIAVMLMAYATAQPLPVKSMSMAPDQIAQSLRTGQPAMVPSDCDALDLWECTKDERKRVTDISLRWVQLDSDSDLEAILVLATPAEMGNVAYVFDKQDTWKLVGSFFCLSNRCNVNTLVRVQQLTDDSPPLLLCYRDLGGSGSSIQGIEGYGLRDGRLWPAFELTKYGYVPNA